MKWQPQKLPSFNTVSSRTNQPISRWHGCRGVRSSPKHTLCPQLAILQCRMYHAGGLDESQYDVSFRGTFGAHGARVSSLNSASMLMASHIRGERWRMNESLPTAARSFRYCSKTFSTSGSACAAQSTTPRSSQTAMPIAAEGRFGTDKTADSCKFNLFRHWGSSPVIRPVGCLYSNQSSREPPNLRHAGVCKRGC